MKNLNFSSYDSDGPSLKTVLILIGVIAFLGFTFVGITKSVVNVDAGEIVVVQHPISGELDVYTDPGVHAQYWGTVTSYRRSFQYDFTSNKYTKDGSSSDLDRSIKIRFNDGGHAQLSGSVRIDLPTNKADMIALHKRYGSQQSIENDLVDKVVTKAAYLSGTLMSSKESYAEKRNDLINYISDQAEHGIYKSYQREIKQKDPITGEDKTVMIVEYVKDSLGGYARQEKSPLELSHIGFSNLSILGMDYEPAVEKQIKGQQELTMKVQTAIAQAKEAEQRAMTTAKEGEATAAKARWEQEALKAKAVTEAEQQLEVARLNAQTEAQNKQAMQLKGEGEAAYKRAVTQANNNVEMRIEAWKEVNLAYAKAMENSNWVPTWVSAGAGGGSGNYSTGALNLIEMMTAKTAMDFGVNAKPSK